MNQWNSLLQQGSNEPMKLFVTFQQLIKIQKAYKELEMKQGSNMLNRTQSESTLKENTLPRKAMDLHRGAGKPFDSPRMFLSGDYTWTLQTMLKLIQTFVWYRSYVVMDY